jgi:hypothetical protein
MHFRPGQSRFDDYAAERRHLYMSAGSTPMGPQTVIPPTVINAALNVHRDDRRQQRVQRVSPFGSRADTGIWVTTSAGGSKPQGA